MPIRKILRRQFSIYLLVGAVATIIDWSFFYLTGVVLKIHYLVALTISFSAGSATNYVLNRIYTFRSRTNKIISQCSVFLCITIISLFLSNTIIFFFVDIFLLHKMLARIATTFIVVGINYLMHKFFTFNKMLFNDEI